MRRALLALVPALALFGAPVASADEGLSLAASHKGQFPDRTYVLTAPAGAEFAEDAVEVTENGAPVRGLSVEAAEAGDQSLGVVLVIDASNSMKGEKIERAMDAARAFAAARDPEQPLAIVTFNSKTELLLPFTTDADQIARALETAPPLAEKTRIYDAVDRALAEIKSTGVEDASMIVLSDGADTASSLSPRDAAMRSGDAGVRVFSVGLGSDAPGAQSLEGLAEATGGSYSEAGSADELERIYATLGEQLASQYVVTYESRVPRATDVRVQATVDGVGTAFDDYVTPRADRNVAPAPKETFWSSNLALILVVLACAFPIGLLVVGVLLPRRSSVGDRLSHFLPTAGQRALAENGGGTLLSMRLMSGAERSLERLPWWDTFKEQLDVARIEMSAARVVATTTVGTLFVALLMLMVFGSPAAVLLAAGVPMITRVIILKRLVQQRKLFADQLADNLRVVASAMRAGHSLPGALAVVVEDAAEPSKTEFGRIVTDEQLGVPLEDAIAEAVRRTENRDLEQVSLVSALQREAGGNTAEVLDQVADNVRARTALRRLVETLTAQGRLTRYVVTALPFMLTVAISMINPDYLSPLYETTMGVVLIAVALCMIAVGSMALKRIVEIDL